MLRTTILDYFERLFDAGVNSVRVESVFRQQQLRISMSDDAIGHAHSHHANSILQTIFFQQFDDGRTKAAGEIGFFDSNNQALGARQRQQQSTVEWLHES